ncbi:MAG: long-chain fatty acid--CoA ligase [Deltaproteobacteria bacterium]|nr:long-chain fatty acid--CoA ligase [Deltaproteobacteria bacterium]
MVNDQVWHQHYDKGLKDIDPSLWETDYISLLKNSFRDRADKPAFYYMGVTITFSDLDLYSNKFANMLLSNGISKGDVVGVNLPNIPEFVIALIGALKAGCVVTGVSPLLSMDEMEFQLKDCKTKVVVSLDAMFQSKVEKIAPNLPDLKITVAASVGDFLPGMKRFLGKLLKKIPKGKVSEIPGKKVFKFNEILRGNKFGSSSPEIKISPDDLAMIMYTGGTTGIPKGAMLTHRNICSDIILVKKWVNLGNDGVGLSGFPFFHIAGTFFNLGLLNWGWAQVLIPNPRDTDMICKEMERHKPRFLVNVPSLYFLLMDNPKFRELDHSKLEICISSAAPFPEESMKDLAEIIGEGKLLEVYGMSETSPLTVANPLKGLKKLGSIGMPLLNTDVKLISPETGEEVGPGESGEICVKGPQVMKGYYNKPGETENVFYENGYMRTGDVAVFDEKGYLTLVDRVKDMIIVSGFKVFSKKVEEVMAEHPAIEMSAIIGLPNPDKPGSEIVKQYIMLTSAYRDKGHAELKSEIIDFAKEKLARYEIPKELIFRDELPLTTIGKLDKKLLRKEG